MKTETMDGFGKPRVRAAPSDAGLVLLYAEDSEAIPAAFVLSGEIATIGREPGPGGLVIPQTAVSRLHARLARNGDAWSIADLDSRNGVIVNGRFLKEAVLQAGDQVRIGDAIFQFVADRASAYAKWSDAARHGTKALVGGLKMDAIRAELETFATSDLTALLLGETGTGKELAARALHEGSHRKGKFVALNCAAIPANLVESELFGFRRGAFTGADRDHPGLVRTAHGGTLLLDEIGDMPLEAQAKLLRMLETREIVPIGSGDAEKVDVRVVCATHRDLRAAAAEGRFRADLFARIQGCTITLPPLRERKEDLSMLVRHFLGAKPSVTFAFMTNVLHYDWPFNVRELEAAIRRAQAVAGNRPLDAEHLPDAVRAVMNDYGKPLEARPATKEAPPPARTPSAEELRAALTEHKGNVAAVARHFGKDRTQVHRWLRMHGIAPEKFRAP